MGIIPTIFIFQNPSFYVYSLQNSDLLKVTTRKNSKEHSLFLYDLIQKLISGMKMANPILHNKNKIIHRKNITCHINFHYKNNIKD